MACLGALTTVACVSGPGFVHALPLVSTVDSFKVYSVKYFHKTKEHIECLFNKFIFNKSKNTLFYLKLKVFDCQIKFVEVEPDVLL